MWGIGAWLRSTRAAEAERRRRVAEDTRNAERTRIARELHDVVTHHVTAMVVQAEAARYLTTTPERLDQTLTAVTDTGRQAITDLRHLLDVLNPDHGTEAATPSARGLRTLVEQTRRALSTRETRGASAAAGRSWSSTTAGCSESATVSCPGRGSSLSPIGTPPACAERSDEVDGQAHEQRNAPVDPRTPRRDVRGSGDEPDDQPDDGH